MIEYKLEHHDKQASPPTRELIEQIREKQLKALKALRRQLLDIREREHTAA